MKQPEISVQRLDLTAHQAKAEEQQRAGAIASLVGADLNVNLVRLLPDESLDAGSALYVPKNMRRAIRAGSQGVTYLICHRRRGGLMPTSRNTTRHSR